MNATTTPAPRQRKPRQKLARFARVVIPPDGIGVGVVRLTVGGKSADYLLTTIPADFGRGFKVEKVGLEGNGEVYHVNLDGASATCDCKGFARWSHCKHADGLAALIAAGRL
jgi:hypothetical protein